MIFVVQKAHLVLSDCFLKISSVAAIKFPTTYQMSSVLAIQFIHPVNYYKQYNAEQLESIQQGKAVAIIASGLIWQPMNAVHLQLSQNKVVKSVAMAAFTIKTCSFAVQIQWLTLVNVVTINHSIKQNTFVAMVIAFF